MTISRKSLRFLSMLSCLFFVCGSRLASAEDDEKSGQTKAKVELGKNVFLEVNGETRRVWVAARVCLREGQLELLLTLAEKKEHEAILAADIDAKVLHAALLAAKAKQGTPVKFEPKFVPAKGQTIKVTLQYEQKGKSHSVDAQEWVKETKTGKAMSHKWVFAGSQFVPNPFEEKGKPLYAAQDGDLISVSNFDTAILDLPIASPKADMDLLFEAFTKKIPPLDTKVWVILEPVK